MSGASSDANGYTVPSGNIGLKGPVAKPAPGTLPLRGDLAHIALAGTHLAAHYVDLQLLATRHSGATYEALLNSNCAFGEIAPNFEALNASR